MTRTLNAFGHVECKGCGAPYAPDERGAFCPVHDLCIASCCPHAGRKELQRIRSVRLDDDEGYLFCGVRIVKRFTRGAPSSDRGFWLIEDRDDKRYYSLNEVKTTVLKLLGKA